MRFVLDLVWRVANVFGSSMCCVGQHCCGHGTSMGNSSVHESCLVFHIPTGYVWCSRERCKWEEAQEMVLVICLLLCVCLLLNALGVSYTNKTYKKGDKLGVFVCLLLNTL